MVKIPKITVPFSAQLFLPKGRMKLKRNIYCLMVKIFAQIALAENAFHDLSPAGEQ
ncbi:hypothetical protein [Shewanella salipaludis]|uniref:Uncharacterized protein n=1 Tax=Shewanella salipaludis TaxID=2723052 RepID=A0A972G539_9GAMM|nr:hypothetical protein [Shewanella salipaludis]NMH64620.1 hypothetical protein [Shewanella salipaludis]